MKLSFKQFSAIVDFPGEQITEEQLDEILGLDKVKDAIMKIANPAERQRRLAALEKEKADAASAAFYKRKTLRTAQKTPAKPFAKPVAKAYDNNPTVAQRASGLKAAERDWVADLAH